MNLSSHFFFLRTTTALAHQPTIEPLLGLDLCARHNSSQILVYALDNDIMIKLPFQYIISDKPDDNNSLHRVEGMMSFIAMERELAVHNTMATHPNIAHRL